MLKFRTRRVDRKSNTPIISDKQLDEFARDVLLDYKPKLLKEPGKINWEYFLESYCEVNLCYYDIYNADPARPILGITAFNDEPLYVFDREEKRITKKDLERVTVVIDNSVMESPNEGYARFTGLHEGGHTLIHEDVFTRNTNQLALFEFAREIAPPPSTICCRKENIESFGNAMPSRGYITPEQWREHHADYFAAAIAMPNDTFRPFALEALHNYAGFRCERLVLDDFEDESFARHRFSEMIRDAFGISKQAAFIKLKKCGFVVERQQFEREQRQAPIALAY